MFLKYLRVSYHVLYNVPQFGFGWFFSPNKLKPYWQIYYIFMEVPYSFQYIVSRATWYQFGLLLGMLNLLIWFKWVPEDFSTIPTPFTFVINDFWSNTLRLCEYPFFHNTHTHTLFVAKLKVLPSMDHCCLMMQWLVNADLKKFSLYFLVGIL